MRPNTNDHPPGSSIGSECFGELRKDSEIGSNVAGIGSLQWSTSPQVVEPPSPTFSHSIILGGTPFYLVIRGEHPGVYPNILAADDALGLAPDALIRRVFGELDALRTFARLSAANQVHRI
ncbi:hypothetical protein F5887DRAFT_1083855 [Amanita rubescens]|nr:hypothetical protein F5887DRAFT_1083855 [Amanita rubescens]